MLRVYQQHLWTLVGTQTGGDQERDGRKGVRKGQTISPISFPHEDTHTCEGRSISRRRV